MAGVPAPRPLLGAVLLLFVSAAWGSAFPLMKDLIVRLPVEDLLAERYSIAALTLVAIRPRCLRGLSRETWAAGIALGLMFGVGQFAQAVALDDLPSSVSGFAVGSSVIITPLLGLALFRVKVQGRVWAGVVLAMASMGVFSILSGGEDQDIHQGALAATLGAAALYSGHTLLLARVSRAPRSGSFNAYAVTVIQLGTIGGLTGVYAGRDGLVMPATNGDWLILAHLSVVACALGFLARSYGQVHVPAVPSAVLMSSQPLWVSAIAVVWFGEQVGLSLLVGGGLMGAAMLLAISAPRDPEPADDSGPEGPPGPSCSSNLALLEVSRRASQVLADLRVKHDEPVRFDRAPSAYPMLAGCGEQACPWSNRAVKGGDEPSLDRMLQRASAIVRARSMPGPGCCRSVTVLGRCLCELVEESEQAKTTASWFRPH
ncbi:DMT family transporter [Nonomuraea longicatena]|uniref:EamA domain-containing protein n=1 Tax=Nonomuraea longicatena TaxID=83682 RepID=A0ABP3Z3P4_9ACTN